MSEYAYKPASSEELEQEVQDWENRIIDPRNWIDTPESVPNIEGSTAISLRVPNQLLSVLKAFAEREGIGYQVLIKQWLDQRIRDERRKLVEEQTVTPREAKMVDIATKLLEKSKKGKLAWSSDLVMENRFSVDFPGTSVSISRTRSKDYMLSVLNELGTEVDTLHAPNKPERDPRPSGQAVRIPDYYYTLKELFEVARRTALKPDAVLDNLLARLSAEE